ncbi:uncharacterized protein VTP21DRAFT_9625 [Calcarisporiella thermophila]|uniref:uncharacterized protein n=1 Tax=Calcarisporiella thermophila TaxID=911321 RepID=UPI003743E19A
MKALLISLPALVLALASSVSAKYVCHCSSKSSASVHNNALTKKAYNHVHFKVLNCPGDKFREKNPIMDNISTYDTDGADCATAFKFACKSFGAKQGWCANL